MWSFSLVTGVLVFIAIGRSLVWWCGCVRHDGLLSGGAEWVVFFAIGWRFGLHHYWLASFNRCLSSGGAVVFDCGIHIWCKMIRVTVSGLFSSLGWPFGIVFNAFINLV